MRSVSIISRLFILAALLSFLSGCEYRDHYIEQVQKASYHYSLDGDQIPYLTGVSLWILPDQEKLKELDNALRQSQKRIWIEIYSWTEKSTLEQVIAAKKRGVDVRVILEGNVYGSPEINRTFYERLLMEGVPVRYANNHFFTFTHAKFWIIDDSFYISTGNFSYSAFATNRELIIFGKNVSIVTDLSAIFTSDTADRFFRSQTTPGLLVSPISMRSGITTLLQSATSSIFLYVQSFTDKDLIELLRKKSEEGIRITVCIADKGENDDTDDEAIETLRGSRIFIKKVKKPYPHLKFINIDSNTWFIGSTNLTQNALDNNREIGLIFHPEITLRDAIGKIPVNECPITKK